MNFKIPFLAGSQKESDGVNGILAEIKSGNTELKEKEDILIFRDKLKMYGISFRDLLTCAPKHKDSRVLCIKIAKAIAEDERLLGKMVKTKTLPIQEILKVVNVCHGTLEKNRKFVIALCLIMTSGLEVLNGYISQIEGGGDQNV